VHSSGPTTAEGAIKEIDRGGKKLVIKSPDGTEQTFTLTVHAAADGDKEVAADTEKRTKVVVYSTKNAGKQRPSSNQRHA
jgi:VCBS repeat-containing protein